MEARGNGPSYPKQFVTYLVLIHKITEHDIGEAITFAGP
jgi:hypothetical protein